MQSLKLNIGGGNVKIDGFTNIDRKLGTEAYPLAYDDNSVDEIRASHILEHFNFEEVPRVLAEWVRVLKPGGRIRIAVPDIDKVMELRQKGDPKWSRYIMGGQTHENDYHRALFSESDLRSAMERAGLTNIARWTSPNTDTAAHPCSLNLEGVRTDVAPAKPEEYHDIKVGAVMSIPRYGANTARGCIESTLKAFGIPLGAVSGAFWGHHLQGAMELYIDKGVDWLVTFDYDTMCTPDHLDRLFHWMGTRPEIDAIAAMQPKRGDNPTPLLTIKGQTETEIDGTPIKVNTAHFGMTVFRVEALKRVPLPWFWELPTIHGAWKDASRPYLPVAPWLQGVWDVVGKALGMPNGEHHIDSDIFFWKQWEAAGNSLYVAPDVRVGHLEEIVSEIGPDMKPRHRHVQSWRDSHSEQAQ